MPIRSVGDLELQVVGVVGAGVVGAGVVGAGVVGAGVVGAGVVGAATDIGPLISSTLVTKVHATELRLIT